MIWLERQRDTIDLLYIDADGSYLPIIKAASSGPAQKGQPRPGVLVAVLTFSNMAALVSVVGRQGHVAQLREISRAEQGSAQEFGWYGFATGLGELGGPLLGGFSSRPSGTRTAV